ncbi:TROVE domain-containing protein [Catalinimonas alkaloidigena]|uniref:TROVE domain-containing protein n=1 Tax=Catalinimonas alkaloidigena TaxID=1075417 RepID=A0A1G9T9P2_9BACT|nr:TROVE domain-containing protein [Catalinimonas alkaloidigena]SDM44360.1 TROVE domain-containing protein [Catalinimonas alkaloidigena]
MRFNVPLRNRDRTRNYEGAEAYTLSPELELYAAVVTTTLSDKFYEGSDERLERIRQLIAQVDPAFVARLAVYAREQMHLRSVPLALTVELARIHTGDSLVGRLTGRVIQRADEITELLACYQAANGRTGAKKLGRLSKQLQKGLAVAFNRFDAYQLAKYDRAAEIRLRDALFLVHPKAKDAAQQALFDRLVRDELQTPYTWETELSATGQAQFATEAEKAAAFRARWEELITSGRLGYMALLRNLRNLLEAGISPAHVDRVCQTLADPRAVARSRQLPFRFLSAYREVQDVRSGYTPQVLDALEAAVLASAANLPGFDGDTSVLVACDVSGSMQRPLSPRSKVQHYDIGLVLGMLLQSRCRNVLTGIFGDTWKTIGLPQQRVLANVMDLRRREGEVGYATNGYLVIQELLRRGQRIDKVMIFTDCQLWDSRSSNGSLADEWQRYRRFAPNARLYVFDLAGYGTAPLRVIGRDVHLIAGWSDKVFDVLAALESGAEALSVIEQIEL